MSNLRPSQCSTSSRKVRSEPETVGQQTHDTQAIGKSGQLHTRWLEEKNFLLRRGRRCAVGYYKGANFLHQ